MSTTWCCGHCKQVRGGGGCSGVCWRYVIVLMMLTSDQWAQRALKQQTPSTGDNWSERDEWVRVRPAIITTRVGLWEQWEHSSPTWASHWSVKPSQPRACPLIGREDPRPESESERVLLSSLARVTCDDLRPGIILSLTLGFWLRIAQRGRGIKGKVKTFILNIY